MDRTYKPLMALLTMLIDTFGFLPLDVKIFERADNKVVLSASYPREPESESPEDHMMAIGYEMDLGYVIKSSTDYVVYVEVVDAWPLIAIGVHNMGATWRVSAFYGKGAE